MIVVFTGCDRPHYMRQTLESWSQVRGVGGVVLEFHLEPGCPEVAEVCKAAGFAETRVFVNETKLGSQRNPFKAISSGFAAGADFVVYADDDFIVSPDVLEYFGWCRDHLNKPGVLCACACQLEQQPGGLPGVLLQRTDGGRPVSAGFWVWGTWRDRWEQLIGPDWTFGYEHDGYDWRLSDYWLGERGYFIARPSLSRSQHIGRDGGVHMLPEDFDRLQAACFVRDVGPQQYRLLD